MQSLQVLFHTSRSVPKSLFCRDNLSKRYHHKRPLFQGVLTDLSKGYLRNTTLTQDCIASYGRCPLRARNQPFLTNRGLEEVIRSCGATVVCPPEPGTPAVVREQAIPWTTELFPTHVAAALAGTAVDPASTTRDPD